MAFGTTLSKMKNAVVVVVFVFLKHDSLFGRKLAENWQIGRNSHYFYKEELIPNTNFCILVTPFVCT